MSLLPELKKAHVKVTVTNMQEMGRACGRFLDMLKAGTLKHPRDEYQPQLAAAVKGATTRPLGQSGAIAWNKLGSDVDITRSCPPLSPCMGRSRRNDIREDDRR